MSILRISLGALLGFFIYLISKDKAERLKNKKLYYNSLISSCDAVYRELSYSKRNVLDALNLDYSSSDFVKTLNNYYLKNKTFVLPNYLCEDEVLKVKEYLNLLGKTDTESQKTAIISYKTEFENYYLQAEKEFIRNYHLIKKLGVIICVMVVIVVM